MMAIKTFKEFSRENIRMGYGINCVFIDQKVCGGDIIRDVENAMDVLNFLNFDTSYILAVGTCFILCDENKLVDAFTFQDFSQSPNKIIKQAKAHLRSFVNS